MHLQHIQHQLSLDGAGLRGSDVESTNSSSDCFKCLCISASKPKLQQNRISIENRSHLRRQTVETNFKLNPASWIIWLHGVDCPRFIGSIFRNCVALLTLDYDTPVSCVKYFSYFLVVCSILPPVLYNFPSVSIRRVYFCFLSIKSSADLTLFTKL
jgi:hypothetical protein